MGLGLKIGRSKEKSDTEDEPLVDDAEIDPFDASMTEDTMAADKVEYEPLDADALSDPTMADSGSLPTDEEDEEIGMGSATGPGVEETDDAAQLEPLTDIEPGLEADEVELPEEMLPEAEEDTLAEEEEGEKKRRFGLFSFLSRRGTRKIKKSVRKSKELKPTEIPEITDPNLEEVELREIRPPYSYTRVLLDKELQEYIYEVIEPQLNDRDREILDFIVETMKKTLDYLRDDLAAIERLREKLRKSMDEIIFDYALDIDELTKEKMFYYVDRNFLGYGKLTVFMEDTELEDLSCDGTDVPMFVYHRKYNSIKSNVVFETDEELEAFVIQMAQRSGEHISIANPVLDATLPDGSRLNATLGKEVTTRGSSFTIRKFKEDPITIPDLIRWRTLSSEMAAHLWLAVQYGESMICSGGTASGKTTTLNAISLFIPPGAKIITIEDTREMNLPQENWIAGVTREAAGEDSGAQDIDMFQLLKAALRQRPEYVIVGEVRGPETMTCFQAMATGHTAYATMHADSVASIVHRLENPPISIPRILLQALNLVILQGQVRVKGTRTRRIKELVEIIGLEPTTNEIITNRVYKWTPAGDIFKYGGHSKLYERIAEREDMTEEEVLEELDRRTEVLNWMVEKHVHSYIEVGTIVMGYYKDQEKLMGQMQREMSILNTFNETLKTMELKYPKEEKDLDKMSNVERELEKVKRKRHQDLLVALKRWLVQKEFPLEEVAEMTQTFYQSPELILDQMLEDPLGRNELPAHALET